MGVVGAPLERESLTDNEWLLAKLIGDSRSAGSDCGADAVHAISRGVSAAQCENIALEAAGEIGLALKATGCVSNEDIQLFRAEFIRTFRDKVSEASGNNLMGAQHASDV